MTYEPALLDELSFGDVCDAEFLYDVHVREDTRAMGRDIAPARFARRNWGIDTDVPFFMPGVNVKSDQSYALAHGTRQQALVLSDDCLIETALGRESGGPTSRRLLFAPIVEAGAEEVAELQESNFGRFPLPADEHFAEHRIADLRRCFMAGARDVHAALAAGSFRLRSLADDTRGELAIRWSAYALRRGPFVAEDSLEKFAEYLLDSGRVGDEDRAVDAATKLADVVAAAWGYEGRGVWGAGTAADDGREPDETIEQLIAELEQLRSAADAALDAIRAL